jgi:metal-responsive CopG/Arc/MetJ family transcriptional regulator
MKKRGVNSVEAFEDFQNKMDNLTPEEFQERNELIACTARYYMSRKEKNSFAEHLIKTIGFLKKNKDESAGEKLSKLIMKEAKEASKL